MLTHERINDTADYMKPVLSDDGTGHDSWHVYRAWPTGQAEKVDFPVVELALP